MDTTLVIMAAGMGSRYGGLKQIEPVGPNGEVILNYSVYDAKKAGFNKVVFIIKKEIEHDFMKIVAPRIESVIETEYAFQELYKIPEGYNFPDRTKPWGTAHAIMCAKDKITTPFAVINADDYYGQASFKILHDNLIDCPNSFMIAYKLKNTFSENGTVTRGVCSTENGILTKVTETSGLDKNSSYDENTLVSMNMWGFKPEIIHKLVSGMPSFLDNMKNPLKDEYLLPSVIDNLIHNEGHIVNVFETDDKWFGVTYKEDKPTVVGAIAKFTAEGRYDGI
ncbi:MAG: sugar phosphate nucleotidyltransferase [Bacillota bacterium]|nr:sugar phosphate nucleotidyltransferase [Bacillota bacterium]